MFKKGGELSKHFACLTFGLWHPSPMLGGIVAAFLRWQFFLSGDVCCWAFVSRVPCASTGLGSKIVCSIDEKDAWEGVFVMM